MSNKINFAAARKTVDVEAPEGLIRLRALSVAQLQSLSGEEAFNVAKQLAMAIVDPETGQRIYTTDEDLDNLKEMSVTTSKLLIDALNDLHGVSPAAVEATVKNYAAGKNGASASA